MATSDEAPAYRDAALKVAVCVAMGFVGWVTTADGNPMEDTHMLIWAVLIMACFFVLWTIGARQRRQEAAKAAEERYEERARQREADHAQLLARLDDIDGKLDTQQEALASVMRSDLIHKAQKYVYELGWATPEEITSWLTEWSEYKGLGADGYIDDIAGTVKVLPTVPPKDKED